MYLNQKIEDKITSITKIIMTNNYIKTLAEWFQLKSKLQTEEKEKYQYKDVHEREIVWCSVGLNVGYEMYGKGESFNRPVLVYKKISSELFIGLSMTKKVKKGISGWYEYEGASIVFEQMRTFSIKRVGSRYKKVSKGYFKKIKKALRAYLNLETI